MKYAPLYKHQEASLEFLKPDTGAEQALDFSDPGTGKTRVHVLDIKRRLSETSGKALVIAPKTILFPAWGADIQKFAPDMRYVIASAKNRAQAFATDADIVITNHDAATWLAKNPKALWGFKHIVIDESTAFKHRGSARSKAMKHVIDRFPIRRLLTGSPTSNGILDLWHQALLCDNGERLGNNFWKFRSAVCEPVQNGPGASMVKWVDKPGVEDAVALLIEDITIRHRFEECIDIPANTVRTVPYHLPPRLRGQYDTLRKQAILQLSDTDTATAVHAAALTTKLLQVSSGAVYDGNRLAHSLDPSRYELVAELASQRPQCIVAFIWTHQRDYLVRSLTKAGLTFGIIDGSTSIDDRNRAVQQFQDGEIRVILAHPQSAGHGLTLTKGTATIWASPTYNAEHFHQFNRRIYRAGQSQKTETILIEAIGTLETDVYLKLQKKLDKMHDLLSMLQE